MARKRRRVTSRKRKMRMGECRSVRGKKGIKVCMTRNGPRFRKA